MTFLLLIVECLFHTVCGWIGHLFVKALTFGRIELEWGDGSESVIAEWIGVFIVITAGALITWMIRF